MPFVKRVVALLAVLVGVALAQVPTNTTQVCSEPSSKTDAKDADYFDKCISKAKFKGQKESFNFNSAYIIGTTFTDCTFKKGTDFNYAFWEDVIFRGCVFEAKDEIWFDQALMMNTKFIDCEFKGRVKMSQFTIIDGLFEEVLFKKGATFENVDITKTTMDKATFDGDETLFDRAGVKTLYFNDTKFDELRFQLLASDGIAFTDSYIEKLNCHEPLDEGEFGAKRAEFDNLVISGGEIRETSCDQTIFRGIKIQGTKLGKGTHDFSSSQFTSMNVKFVEGDGDCAELDLRDSEFKAGKIAQGDDLCKVLLGNTTMGTLELDGFDIDDDDEVEIEGAILDGLKVDGKCCIDFCEDRKCLCDIPGEAEDGCPRGSSKTNPNIDPSDDPACFPASANVLLESGEGRTMGDLDVGDRVHVGRGVFSEVYMWTHHDAGAVAEFVELQSQSGAALRLTAGHFIHVNGELVTAGRVRVGDLIELGSGQPESVTAILSVRDIGLYNPQTIHGDIVVDGFRASTYTTAVEPALAHALGKVAGFVYSAFGYSSPVFEGGATAAMVEMIGAQSAYA